MKVERGKLAEALRLARLGTSLRGETLEQSNAFVFTQGQLITFNDEIMTQAPSPLPDEITAAVLADEFIKLVEKFPDKELDITHKVNDDLESEEIIVKGERKEAGVTCFSEILLPFDAVPSPGKWSKLNDKTPSMIQQAARTCGNDLTQELTMLVHVTPKLIEACDNYRLFRSTMDTGFSEEGLLPAASILKLEGVPIKRVAMGEGWAHFRTSSKLVISIRCSHEKYHEGLEALLQVDDAEAVELPEDMAEIVGRSTVMVSLSEDGLSNIRIKLKESQLTVESRKDSGWYRERKKVKYNGGDMEFDVHPKFLVDLLSRTHQALLSPRHRLKIEVDNTEFVVALTKPE